MASEKRSIFCTLFENICTTTGTMNSVSLDGLSKGSVQLVVGGTPTSWTVTFNGSNDGKTYSPLLVGANCQQAVSTQMDCILCATNSCAATVRLFTVSNFPKYLKFCVSAIVPADDGLVSAYFYGYQ
jgi:hypothetical protein